MLAVSGANGIPKKSRIFRLKSKLDQSQGKRIPSILTHYLARDGR